MSQCEARIKKLRYEDTAMRNILRQRRAQKNWDKVYHQIKVADIDLAVYLTFVLYLTS